MIWSELERREILKRAPETLERLRSLRDVAAQHGHHESAQWFERDIRRQEAYYEAVREDKPYESQGV